MIRTPRWAVVANPTKLSDADAELVRRRLAEAGHDPLWLETTEEDPGRAMAEQAVEAGVEVVLTAGGDGTVRVVAAVLARTEVAMAMHGDGRDPGDRGTGVPAEPGAATAADGGGAAGAGQPGWISPPAGDSTSPV